MNLSLSTASFTLARFPLLALATVHRRERAGPSIAAGSTSTSSPATVPGASQPAPAPSAAPVEKPREDFLKRISVNVAPGYFFGSNSDAAPAPSADRTVHLGYNTERRNADILRLDYGADPQHGPELLFESEALSRSGHGRAV